MKTSKNYVLRLMILVLISVLGFISCKPGGEGKSSKARVQDNVILLASNVNGSGKSIEIELIKGKAHNHPTFAFWIEDTAGNYIQTLFVTEALGQGIFKYGDKSAGTWKPGEVHRPAALPYWAHKWGVKKVNGSFEPSSKNKVPDAYSGATPAGSFKLNTRTDNVKNGKVKLMMEINQPWDWNEYWTNALYPDDTDYQTSCQPAVVYSAIIDLDSSGTKIELKPAGHSHYSGKTGELYPDLSTITTALHIAEQITVSLQ
ncbi:MAG: hypothetical protein Q7U54_01625 [Bacteroidales bacterium]|nr:hypothetical protein [Bacteroidales bacterium]